MWAGCRPTLWDALQVVTAQGKPQCFVWFAMKLSVISVTIPLGSIRHLQVQNLQSNKGMSRDNKDCFVQYKVTPVISKIAPIWQCFSLFSTTLTPLKLLEITHKCHTSSILITLPRSLTSSQGHSEDWLQVKSPAPPLAAAPARILGSWRLSPPPGICCYGCDCETLEVHRAALWMKETTVIWCYMQKMLNQKLAF